MNDFVKAVLVAAGLLLAWELSSVLLLIFASVLLAVGLEAMASGTSSLFRVPKKVGFALMFPAVLLILFAVGYLAAPSIASQYNDFAERFPQQAQNAIASLNEMLGTDIPADIEGIRSYVEPSSLLRATQALGSGFGVLADFFFLIIIAVYLAISPKDYSGLLKRISKKRQKQMDKVHHDLKWWLAGRLMSMGVIFVLTTIGLYIIGMPFALILGLLAGLLSFIPNLGPILALVPAIIVGFVQSPAMALYVLLLYVGIQILESYFVTPQIDRKTVSIAPAAQLISQLFFGALFGFMGLLLAVPIAVTLRSFVDLD